MFLVYSRALEQDYRGKLTHIKSEVETEKEQLMQQVTHQQAKLEADIQYLQDEEASLREKLTLAIKVKPSPGQEFPPAHWGCWLHGCGDSAGSVDFATS